MGTMKRSNCSTSVLEEITRVISSGRQIKVLFILAYCVQPIK